jgi:hypothetical protein
MSTNKPSFFAWVICFVAVKKCLLKQALLVVEMGKVCFRALVQGEWVR